MRKIYLLTIAATLMCSLFTTTSCSSSESSKTDSTFTQDDTLVIIQKDTFCLNESNVYQMIVQEQILHPKIVLKQSILETGWFKSDYCKNRNNLFGFRNSQGYMSFNSPSESVSFYKQWQTLWYSPIKGDYYKFLSDIKYAEDSTYIDKLKQIQINV